MSRKIKVRLIDLILVTDSGDGKVLVDDKDEKGWTLTKNYWEVTRFDDAKIRFNPWQIVDVGLMGECMAVDSTGTKHRIDRYVGIRTDKGLLTDELRPVDRKDLKGADSSNSKTTKVLREARKL